MINEKLPAGIYIHIPFCLQKCAYCDFFSLEAWDEPCLQTYVEALISELKMRREEWADRHFSSIYFGGGTPSLLSPAQIGKILDQICRLLIVDSEAEISMEANPATLNLPRLRSYRSAGVNRISLGVQSFFDDELALLGRIHSASDVYSTVDLVDRAGFDNFNLDLIYGLPGQTAKRWQENLNRAAELKPDHLSCYLLQLEDDTPMGQKVEQGKLVLPDDEVLVQIYDQTRNFLRQCGYIHYEISNFSIPGQECRHNLFYWKAYDYLGLGAGAVSKIHAQRRLNKTDLEQYMKTVAEEKLPPQIILESMNRREQLADALIMGLRLMQGVDREELLERFGMDIYLLYQEEINTCLDMDLITITGDNLRLTERGYFVSNEVFCRFLP